MNKRRLNEIEKIAQSVIESTLDNNNIPKVAVQLIARKKNISVKKEDWNDDVSGVLIINNNNVTIGINRNQARVRQRFTIAHELGHFFLGHKRDGLFIDNHNKHFGITLYRDKNSSLGEILQEKEANAFAAALLMPKSRVVEAMKDRSFDFTNDEDLKALAKLFDVSQQAMSIRLSNLGLFRLY